MAARKSTPQRIGHQRNFAINATNHNATNESTPQPQRIRSRESSLGAGDLLSPNRPSLSPFKLFAQKQTPVKSTEAPGILSQESVKVDSYCGKSKMTPNKTSVKSSTPLQATISTPGKSGKLGRASRVYVHGTSKVRVVARVRPFTEREIQVATSPLQSCVSLLKGGGGKVDTLTVSDEKTGRNDSTYELDACYDEATPITSLFAKEVEPVLDGIYAGMNATIFAYGATGSGKSHTMQGSSAQPGLMTMAVERMLTKRAQAPETCQVALSYLEVYMDRCYDLLEPKKELQVLDDYTGRVSVPNLAEVEVRTMAEFQQLFAAGCERRRTGATGLNDKSSRSHGCLILEFSQIDADAPHRSVVGKLHLIDLAGNEDNRRTGNDGVRLAESSGINQSLFALSKVITALNKCAEAGVVGHVPYRDSKLTRLLQDSLGGTAAALMIACLNPGEHSEAMHTLSLASKSRQVENQLIPSREAGEGGDMALRLKVWREVKGKTPARVGRPGGGGGTPRKELLSPAVILWGQGADGGKAGGSTRKSSVVKSGREGVHMSSFGPIEKLEGRLAETCGAIALSQPQAQAQPQSQPQPRQAASSDVDSASATSSSANQSSPDVSLGGGLVHMVSKSLGSTFHISGTSSDATNRSGSPSLDQWVPASSPAVSQLSTHLQLGAGSPRLSSLLMSMSKALTPQNTNTTLHTSVTSQLGSGVKLKLASEFDRSYVSMTCAGKENEDLTADGDLGVDYTSPARPQARTICPTQTEVTPRRAAWEGGEGEEEVAEGWTPFEKFARANQTAKIRLEREYLLILNSAEAEHLCSLKGIGIKRAEYILDLRKTEPNPFREIRDLQKIGLSAKQAKGLFEDNIVRQIVL